MSPEETAVIRTTKFKQCFLLRCLGFPQCELFADYVEYTIRLYPNPWHAVAKVGILREN